jgi:hypothetical protein
MSHEAIHCSDCGRPALRATHAGLFERGWKLLPLRNGHGEPVTWWRCVHCCASAGQVRFRPSADVSLSA